MLGKYIPILDHMLVLAIIDGQLTSKTFYTFNETYL